MGITRAYIDGFNLYYGIIRANRLHWLDLEQFAARLNMGVPVDRVIYCTAMVSSHPSDPQKAQRQDAYHRALAITCPKVEILLGNFSTNKKLQPIAGCTFAPTCAMKVSVRTEKGSDVNLSARLLHDAHMNRFDRAIVVSGDSDLVEPIKLITQEVGKEVWVRNPRNMNSMELSAVASGYDRIRPSVLMKSQLCDPVTDGKKVYRKPAKWSQPLRKLTKTTVLAVACRETGYTKQIASCRYQ